MFMQSSMLRLSTNGLACQHDDVAEKVVHPSLVRLLDFAQAHHQPGRSRITSYGDLAARMDVSSATMTNWKKRGISLDGALAAEREFGCFASWVLDGATPPATRWATGPAMAITMGEPVPTWFDPGELLVQFGALLALVPKELRASFGDVLAGWAISGGADDRRVALLKLLEPYSKRHAAR